MGRGPTAAQPQGEFRPDIDPTELDVRDFYVIEDPPAAGARTETGGGVGPTVARALTRVSSELARTLARAPLETPGLEPNLPGLEAVVLRPAPAS